MQGTDVPAPMTHKPLRWLGLALALAAVVAASVGAYEGKRLFQVLVLALPVGLCLCWPSRHKGWRALQAGLAGVLGVTFLLDGVVRGFLMDVYGASPASTLVITAMANTTAQEVAEFITMYGTPMAWRAVFVGVTLVLLCWGLRVWWRWPFAPRKLSRGHQVCWLLVFCLVLLSLLSKPWRQHHPVVFWPQWMGQVASLKAHWSNFADQRQRLFENARQHPLHRTPQAPDTVVLVIGESINRGHLSLYGYPRNTSPELVLREQTEAGRLGVFRHAWSVNANTVEALRNFFYLGQSQGASQHVLALASAAGYRTWWISNHDDLAIDQEHAQLADVVQMLNKVPGRSGLSLDASTLPWLTTALKDEAPRKLIVVHLLGAHPHYELRRPPSWAPFSHAHDQVERDLRKQGRSARVRDLRNDYDSAVHYHDSVLTATLDLTRQYGKRAAWAYFSDHGQEVGHSSEHVGHSALTAEGYRVPLLLWGDAVQALPNPVFTQPVRTDWLGYSVLRLLGIEWDGHVPQQDVLDPQYRWIPPGLGMVRDFRS